MNSPSAASSSVAQSHSMQLRAPARGLASDHHHSFPQSVSHELMQDPVDEMQQRQPTRPWDTERTARSGASSPPFPYDSPTGSTQSGLGRGGTSPNLSGGARRAESPLSPLKAPEHANPAQRTAPSPLAQINWAAQSAAARAESNARMDAFTRIESQNRADLSKVVNALTDNMQKVEKLIRLRARDEGLMQDLAQQIKVLGQQAGTLGPLKEDIRRKDQELRALIAQANDRVDGTTNKIKNLTDLCVENTEDKFEALGPLPKNYRKVQTTTGPYALHNDVYRRLIPCLVFHTPKDQPDGRQVRMHVEVSREMLSHLVMWKNGLSLAPDLIGFASLRDLCSFARRNDIQELLEVCLKELHEAGMRAMAQLLQKLPRPQVVETFCEGMMRAMCELQAEVQVPTREQSAMLRVMLPRPSQAIVRPGPLFLSEERAPDWRQDLTFAFRAFLAYCAVFRATCHPTPQIELCDGDRSFILNIGCELAI